MDINHSVFRIHRLLLYHTRAAATASVSNTRKVSRANVGSIKYGLIAGVAVTSLCFSRYATFPHLPIVWIASRPSSPNMMRAWPITWYFHDNVGIVIPQPCFGRSTDIWPAVKDVPIRVKATIPLADMGLGDAIVHQSKFEGCYCGGGEIKPGTARRQRSYGENLVI